PAAHYHEAARVLWLEGETKLALPGITGLICAGTTDIPVAEEAGVTLEVMGGTVERIYDVGVAGLHRLLSYHQTLQRCNVIICVAGMEGALPSVVGGLVDVPVIAVPTSVGYGAAFGGLAALLGMLNSCAKGLSVVNIDNGFGAAAFAATILKQIQLASVSSPDSPKA
ncbi:MAG TPA: nickel pincer cofactor biosynthesis protein LarB, partial [Abditibacteriaceae bacterium]